jgi:ribonuclease HI
MHEYEVYTDGTEKYGKSAWAFIILQNGEVICERFGRVKKANSNMMEYQAFIEALQSLPEPSAVTVHTDSRILIENIAKLGGWRANNWAKKNGRPIPYVEQLKIIYGLLQIHRVKLAWVKAHSGNAMNERCDALCISARS